MAEPSMKATPGPMTVMENKIPAEGREQRGAQPCVKGPWGQEVP